MYPIQQTSSSFSPYLQPIVSRGRGTFCFLQNNPRLAVALAAITFLGVVFRQALYNYCKYCIREYLPWLPKIRSTQILKNSLDRCNPSLSNMEAMKNKDLCTFLQDNPLPAHKALAKNSLRYELHKIAEFYLPFVPKLWSIAKKIAGPDITQKIRGYENLLLTVRAIQYGKLGDATKRNDMQDEITLSNPIGIDLRILEQAEGNAFEYGKQLRQTDKGRLTLIQFDAELIDLEGISAEDITQERENQWQEWLASHMAAVDLKKWTSWMGKNYTPKLNIMQDPSSPILDLDTVAFRSLVLTLEKYPNIFKNLPLAVINTIEERLRTTDYQIAKREVLDLTRTQLCSLLLYFQKHPDAFTVDRLPTSFIFALLARIRGDAYEKGDKRIYQRADNIYKLEKEWESFLPIEVKNTFTSPSLLTPDRVKAMPQSIACKFAELAKENFEQPGTWEAIQKRKYAP